MEMNYFDNIYDKLENSNFYKSGEILLTAGV